MFLENDAKKRFFFTQKKLDIKNLIFNETSSF